MKHFLILSLIIGLSALVSNPTKAGDAKQTCLLEATDGHRQNANLLLFLLDDYLVQTNASFDISPLLSDLPPERFDITDFEGKTQRWLSFEPLRNDADAETPSLPEIVLRFGRAGYFKAAVRSSTVCEEEASSWEERGLHAFAAQKRRLDIALQLALNCKCISQERLMQVANWAQEAHLDFSPDAMNLFQPYVALGPKVVQKSERHFHLEPVPRGPNLFGYVPLEDMEEATMLQVHPDDPQRIIRAVPYFMR